ncbi:MAG: MATE family efflux transporter [Firmicutes bacterium]|nr:MATE family efflux transporter [Bacillota bacterium]
MWKKRRTAEKRMMFSIALPIMIQRITHHLMLLIDRAFVGNLDARYLSAIGNVMIPYNAMTFIFFAIATGLTVLVAQNVGRKDYQRAQELSQSAFFYLTLISTGLFLLWFIGAESVFSLFGATGDVLQFSTVYVRIIAVYMIFFGIEVAAASILEGVGTTRPIMMVGVIRSVLNIFLDWLLIFGHWGLPALGLQGAALATLIANLIGCAILFSSLFLQGNLPFSLERKALFKPEWQPFREITRRGIPSGVEIFLYQSGNLVLVRFLNQIDGMAIVIYSLVTSLQTIPVLIYMGFAKATTTMVGQYWGEERFADAKKITLYAQKISVTTCALMGAIFALIPGTLIRIFTSDPEVLARAGQLLRISGILLVFQSSNIVSGHAIRATGDTKWMLYSQIYGTIFVVGFSAYAIFYLEWGLLGLYLTTMFDELTRGIINFLRFYFGVNPLRKLPELSKALRRRGVNGKGESHGPGIRG